MPRKHLLLDVMGKTYADLDETYRKLGTIKKTAEHYGVSVRTVKNWMEEANIKGLKHFAYERTLGKASVMRKWIKANPGVQLPRNERKIAEQTGISFENVHSYFSRRRTRVTYWLQRLPPLTSIDTILKEDSGAYLPTKNIASYAFKVDRYNLRILVYGRRKTGPLFKYTTNLKDYVRLVTVRATEDPSGQEHP